MKIIAHIYNDYTEKFGIPRQSGLNQALLSRIVMEPEYRVREAFRGIEAYSHLWLIWEFSQVPAHAPFSPTVRPPRLGGNTRLGVFATRSPFRPNRLGLSCVELIRIEESDQGPVLLVAGADLMNGTPLYDIKPYLP
ncbi:MAG: tRNA (N6-threonylcarbamoyladenosine(37)-N6)-methyltransferase TrmO, partial [Lachnospiraceae bacterium]|nr:tRNA (N6-threonylcarbamoyladenosine(37)-N6)-methyltransferase TrmO [Lachnospiraceae bacterium]